MHDFDLKTLRLLVSVCEHGNMGRAAREEHIEPSAISKRIAQLESEFGVPLLTRSRRGVQPTAAGLALIEHVRSVKITLQPAAQRMVEHLVERAAQKKRGVTSRT